MPPSLQVKCVNNGKYNVFIIADDEYISHTIASGHEWDGWMRKDVAECFKEGTEILDIGANIGYNSLMFSDYGPTYAFEPLFHKIVQLNIDNNKLKHKMYSIPFALSDKNDVVDMYLPNAVKNTGLRNYGGSSMYTFEGTDYTTETKVDCKRLDDIYIGKTSFIKIDVEGHELEVLKGAENTIRRCMPTILIEIHNFEKSEVPIFMKSLGYDNPESRPEFMFLYRAKDIFSTI